jgi:hypothetical protein
MVAGSNDAKAVAAIEKQIGQSIPWMEKPLGAPAAPQPASPAPRQPHRQRPDNHRRQPQRPAPVGRLEDARPRHSPAPQHARPRADDSDASHLPAFLLRPVTVKA